MIIEAACHRIINLPRSSNFHGARPTRCAARSEYAGAQREIFFENLSVILNDKLTIEILDGDLKITLMTTGLIRQIRLARGLNEVFTSSSIMAKILI